MNKASLVKFLNQSIANVKPGKARIAFAPVSRDMGNKRAQAARRACRDKRRED